MQQELTEKQKKLLEYFKNKISNTGGVPSLRTTAEDLGISHAAVSQGLKRLEQKGYVKREGRYSRTLHLLTPAGDPFAVQRMKEIPIIGRVTAGLPMYAQQEFDGSIVIDAAVYKGQNLFALRIRGDSMKDAGILDGDIAVCEPRQYAENKEIIVGLIDGEEATVKRFFLHKDHIEFRPENPDYPVMRYNFGQVLIQGKVIGIQRGPEGIR